jgi:hypothetical protein
LCYRCHKFDGHTGYQGQKYEVLYTRDGEEHVMGWQNSESGGLADVAEMMPGVTSVRIVLADRGTGGTEE